MECSNVIVIGLASNESNDSIRAMSPITSSLIVTSPVDLYVGTIHV